MFGTTLYRHIYKDGLGYVTYPIGPNFFKAKEWLAAGAHASGELSRDRAPGPNRGARGWVAAVPLEEQWRTMDSEKLRENVDYARRVGFQDILPVGGEWWYWLKVKQATPGCLGNRQGIICTLWRKKLVVIVHDIRSAHNVGAFFPHRRRCRSTEALPYRVQRRVQAAKKYLRTQAEKALAKTALGLRRAFHGSIVRTRWP
ncbi:MAG: hypothetical protein WDN67_03635 [Candidatus Moraniibacteriota bacterium]